MNVVAGCDVGSLTSKAVIMKDGNIIGFAVSKSKAKPDESAKHVMDQALLKANLKNEDINYCVGTGYGRDKILFIKEPVSEIACHAKGAKWLLPSVKTVIDIGGQDCKVIKVDKDGKAVKFITNDKCASGTGRFLEVMARVLNIGIEDLGSFSLKARSPITFASTCTVWAQADVIKHLNDGLTVEDIGAGINVAMANRVSILISSIGLERDVCMTGGVAKNVGVVDAIEKIVGQKFKKIKKADPQLAGAIGAALFANERLKKEAII